MRRYVWLMLLAGLLVGSQWVYAQQVPGAKSGVEPVYPIATKNRNIANLYHQYQIFLEEMALSLTRETVGTLPQDAERWKSYIDSMRSYISFWQTQLFLDLPVTHGRAWELTEPLPVRCEFKDNVAVCDLQALVVDARDELALSASSTLPMHLLPADLQRQTEYWNAMEGFIDQFMLIVQPLDEPATAAEELLGLEPGGVPTNP